jgi:hypothetical protein
MDFDTILTGAGVSMLSPSDLPSGDELALHLWSAVVECYGSPALAAIRDESLGRGWPAGGKAGGIRLEQLVELLAVDDDDERTKLVAVYGLLKGALPNIQHEAIARLAPRNLVTLNMDLLHECATHPRSTADFEVLHLHGDVDHYATIKTAIGQYDSQLDAQVASQLEEALTGKRVLVIGYSGRDTDVIPILARANPAYVEWYEPMSLRAEAEALLDVWENRGVDVVRFTEPGAEGLAKAIRAKFGVDDPLGIELSAASKTIKVELGQGWEWSPPRRFQISEEMRIALGSVKPATKSNGTAAVLFELDLPAAALTVLDERGFTGESEERRVKLRARSLRRVGEPLKAMAALVAPPAAVGAWPRRLKNNGTEIAAALPDVGLPRAALIVDRTIAHIGSRVGSFRNAATLAEVRVAKRLVLNGDLPGAISRYEQVVELSRSHVIARQPGVDAATWLLDAYRTSGDFGKALTTAAALEIDGEFASFTNRSYVLWKTAELLAYQGAPGAHAAAVRAIEKALELIGLKDDARPPGSAMIAASASTIFYAARPADALKLADSAIETSAGRIGERMITRLNRAELARLEGDIATVQLLTGEVLELERQRRDWPWRCRTAVLAAGLIRAETRRTAGPNLDGAARTSLAAEYAAIARGYRAIHVLPGEIRSRVSLSLLTGDRLDDVTTSTIAAKKWAREADRIAGRDTVGQWFIPI